MPWRDTDLELQGPVVADFQKLFIDTWTRQKGPPLQEANYFPALARQGDAVVRAIGGTASEPYSPIYATFISAIRSAETSILLANAYFDPDPQLLSTLADAARRGVDVQLLLPSVSDSWLVIAAGRRHYGDLLEAGVKIYERRGALLHSKTTVVDGVWSAVGSTNLDWRSFLHNDEINAIVLSASFGDEMKAAFAKDLAQSTPVTLESWGRRSLGRPRSGNRGRHVGVLAVNALPGDRHGPSIAACPTTARVARPGGAGAAALALAAAPACGPRRPPAMPPAGKPPPPTSSSAVAASTLRIHYDRLHDELAHNPFGRPLVMESTQKDDRLIGEVFARIDRPFADVSQALEGTPHWCAILILHLNVKRCHAEADALDMALGR